jgi:hypothetical protein
MSRHTRRQPAGRRQIVVFSEGKVTEPTYVAHWGRRLRAETIVHLDERNGLDPRGLVELAVQVQRRERQDERRGRGPAHDAYWCVFDVDDHARLSEAVTLANDHGVLVALSNPNFELWLLLHRRDQTGALTKDEAARAVRREVGIDKAISPASMEVLIAAHSDAARRAASLDAMHVRNSSDGNPSSGVPQLIEEIGGRS